MTLNRAAYISTPCVPPPGSPPRTVTAKLERHILQWRWRHALRSTGFSIISQNCLGGIIYHDLGLPFTSPTIDLTIYGDDFVRFVEHLADYLKFKAIPAGFREDTRKVYPLIRVGDITVDAVHYESPEDAAQAWNRRAHRVNLNDVRVIATTWDLGSDPTLIERLRACAYPLVVFSGEPSAAEDTLSLTDNGWYVDNRGIVHPVLTDWANDGKRYFEHVFDFVKWLNATTQS